MSIHDRNIGVRGSESRPSILARRRELSFHAEPALTAAQARVDQFVGQTAETLSNPRTAALGLVGVGLISRFANAASLSRILSAFRVGSATEAALASELGFLGLRAAPAFRLAPLGATVFGATIVLAGCGVEDPNSPPPPEATAITPSGSEFQINTDRNTGTNQGVAMALNGNGNLVVAWADNNPSETTQHGVFARAFNSAGTGTAVVAADTPFPRVDVLPSVSTNSRGNFVVSWTNQSDPSSPIRVQARRFGDDGRLIGGIIPVLSTPAGASLQPRSSIVLLEDGGFVVAANDNSDTCGACAYFYNADNTQASVSPLVPSGNTVSTLHVGTTTQGTWTWGALVSSGGSNEIQFQRFNGRTAQGSVVRHPIGGSLPPGAQIRVASLPNGNTMLAWQTNTAIMAQVVDSHGAELFDAVQVAAVEPGASFSLAADEQGSFVVAWEETSGSNSVIRARVINGEGEPILTPLDVSGPSGQNREVVVTANGSGRVSIAWRRFSTEGGAHQDLIARNYQIAY